MCLAIPGLVESIHGDDPMERTGKVSFGGMVRNVNLALVPDVKVGEYVIVHVGMALSKVDAEEAMQIIKDIRLVEGTAEDLP